MDIRYSANQRDVKRYTTEELPASWPEMVRSQKDSVS